MNIEDAITIVREFCQSLQNLAIRSQADPVQGDIYYAQYITAKDILWAITDGAEGND